MNIGPTQFPSAANRPSAASSPFIGQMIDAEMARAQQGGSAGAATAGGGCPVGAVQEQSATGVESPEMNRLNSALGDFATALNNSAGAAG